MDEGARGDAEADDEAERDILASSERKKKAKKKNNNKHRAEKRRITNYVEQFESGLSVNGRSSEL